MISIRKKPLNPVVIILFFLTQCSTEPIDHRDNQQLILGRWQGILNLDTMVIDFTESSVTLDNSKMGGDVRNYSYDFLDKKELSVTGYKDLVIRELTEDKLSFKSRDTVTHEILDVVFAMKFFRASR